MRSLLCYSILILGLVFCFDYATANEAKTLSYKQNGLTMVMLSMSAEFKVIGSDGKVTKKYYQDSDSEATGNFTAATAEKPYSIINFIVSWNNSLEYQFILTFNSSSQNWVWKNSTFVINTDDYTIVPLEKMITSFGDNEIGAKRNHSYVCVSPLDYTSTPISTSDIKVSVIWSQFQVEVMPLNGTIFDPSENPCTVDLDDKIVPIAVGGALGLLLLLVVIIYVISYIRDRRQQSKELRSGYNRIDQPEPNHHS